MIALASGLRVYLACGVTPNVELPTFGQLLAFLGLDHKRGTPLPDGCKRVVWSENIGEAARKRNGWKDRRTMLELENCLNGDRSLPVSGI